MGKIRLFVVIMFSIYIVTFTDCDKDSVECGSEDYQEDYGNQIDANSIANNDDKSIVLGEELEDPYNLKNMQRALDSLKLSKSVAIEELSPTHTYWRFLPKNEEELAALTSDSTISFYEFPLNYEILEEGDYYHDPTLSDSSITWQYAVIPIDYPINDSIEHERLYDVFLPPTEDDDENELSKKGISSSFYEELEYQSMVMTGAMPQSISKKKSRWVPSGTINVWDDKIGNYIPLEGAQVHARYCTHCSQGLTNSKGEFKVNGHYLYKVHYGIKWERGQFDIRRGIFQSWYKWDGRHKCAWNCYIKGGKGQAMATILRVANKIFYGNNLGLIRPHSWIYIGNKNKKIKINYMDNSGTSRCLYNVIPPIISNELKIYVKESGNYKQSHELFRSVSHEFGHLIHHCVQNNFSGTSSYIREAWAVAVAYVMTKDEYAKLGVKFADDEPNFERLHKQDWPDVNDKKYSPLMIDLMDDFNQNKKDPRYPNDNIKGYTIKEIQDKILPKSYGVSSFKQRLKAIKLHGETDNDIDELVKLY